jgi:hypothetical protein
VQNPQKCQPIAASGGLQLQQPNGDYAQRRSNPFQPLLALQLPSGNYLVRHQLEVGPNYFDRHSG